jgi:hypothetical protein
MNVPVQSAIHRQPAVPLQGLSHELAEQNLLGEVLRPDHDCVRAPPRQCERDAGAGHQQERASCQGCRKTAPAAPARTPLQQRECTVRKQCERG